MRSKKSPPKITVLGSGHSGHALAATLSHAGYPTTMVSLSRHQQGLVNVDEYKGVHLTTGDHVSFCLLNCTSDLATAVENSDIIFCTVPAFHHDGLVEKILASIKNGQYIYFSSYFGALKMMKLLKTRPELEDITVVESMSAIHAARVVNYGRVEILATKDEVPIATYPNDNVDRFVSLVGDALPCLTPVENVLVTSLNNVGPILHVPLMLFSTARIESTKGEGWNLYQEGLTDSVQEYIKQLDRERMRIADKLNVRAISLEHTMLNIFYKNQNNGETNFFEWIRNNNVHASKTVGTPPAINTRYLTEGVYYGLAPLARIAHYFSVPTPVIDATIKMADALLNSQDAPRHPNLDYLSPAMIQQVVPMREAA